MEPKEIIDTAKYVTDTLPTIPKLVNNFIDLTVGNWLEYRNALSKEKFKAKLKEKISQIPKEHRIDEPKLSILGPALEATKYYIEEEEIQELFTNLITSSMDTTYNGIIQHSFVEIIKQLSPLDAKLFKNFEKYNPCVNLVLQYPNNSYDIIFENMYLQESFEDIHLNAISLNNLEKQGLIKISSSLILQNPNIYDKYFNNNNLKSDIKEIEKGFLSYPIEKRPKVQIKKKFFQLTPLGEAFKKVCIK